MSVLGRCPAYRGVNLQGGVDCIACKFYNQNALLSPFWLPLFVSLVFTCKSLYIEFLLNQPQLAKKKKRFKKRKRNSSENLKLVSKMGLKNWNTGLGIPVVQQGNKHHFFRH